MDRFDATLRAASNGDAQAWADIQNRYGNMMRLALDQAGMSPELRQRLDPEDVLQHALMRAHHELPRLMPLNQRSFTAWLRKTTIRSLQDRIRHHNRERRSLSGEAHNRVDEASADEASSPVAVAVQAERRHRLLEAIAGLSEADQGLVLWHVIEGLSIRAIAEAIGESPSKLRTCLTKILLTLRRMLA